MVGDSLTRDHNGMKFTTQDEYNDLSSANYAQYRNGARWFRICSDSHLNGEYLGGSHGKYIVKVVTGIRLKELIIL